MENKELQKDLEKDARVTALYQTIKIILQKLNILELNYYLLIIINLFIYN